MLPYEEGCICDHVALYDRAAVQVALKCRHMVFQLFSIPLDHTD